MADNTLQNGTDTIATDDVTLLNGGASSGIKVQRVKVGFGTDNTLRDVDATFGLPVVTVSNSLVSTANSTATALALNAVFTGTAEDVSDYSLIFVTVFADQISAVDGLRIQHSSNGTNWDMEDVFSIPASVGKTFSFGVQARFFRIVYTNGATASTVMRLQTIVSKAAKKNSSVRPQDGRTNDNDFEEMLSFGMSYDVGTNSWNRIRGTISGGLSTSVISPLPAGTNLIGDTNSRQVTPSADVTMQAAAVAAGNGTVLSTVGYGTSLIQLVGPFTGTVVFEGTQNGTDYVLVAATQLGASVISSSATTVGIYRLSVAGLTNIRARISVFGTGTITALGRSTNAPFTAKFVQLVAGTNTIGTVLGTFFQATQPVSATALPLPTGASTETTLAALNTKTTAVNTGAVTISTALPAGANLIGKVGIDQTTQGVTNAVSVTSQPEIVTTGTITTTDIVVAVPSATGVPLTGTPTAGSYVAALATGGNASVVIGVTGLTTGTIYYEGSADSTNGIDGGWVALNMKQAGIVNTQISSSATANGLYRGNTAGIRYIRMRSVGALTGTPAITLRLSSGVAGEFIFGSIPTGTNSIGAVVLTAETTKVIGTVNVSAAQTIAAVTAITNALPTGANTIGAVNIAAAQTLATVTTVGAVTAITNALPTGTNTIGTVNLATPTAFNLSSAATTNATSVKATAGTVFQITASNVGAAAAFLKLFNLTTAPTVGTSVPFLTVPIAPSGVVSIPFGALGMRFGTGIALSITNLVADADATVIAAAQVKVAISYI